MKRNYLNIISILFALLTLTCKPELNERKSKTLSTEYFDIVFPSFLPIDNQSLNDSKKGWFILGKTDSVFYEIGVGVSNLAEKEPQVIYIPVGMDTSNLDLSHIYAAKKINFDIDRYRKQNVNFKNIDGFDAKIVFPRRTPDGITGIYIDSLYKGIHGDVWGLVSFHMYAKNLPKEKERCLIEAFETLNFKKLKKE